MIPPKPKQSSPSAFPNEAEARLSYQLLRNYRESQTLKADNGILKADNQILKTDNRILKAEREHHEYVQSLLAHTQNELADTRKSLEIIESSFIWRSTQFVTKKLQNVQGGIKKTLENTNSPERTSPLSDEEILQAYLHATRAGSPLQTVRAMAAAPDIFKNSDLVLSKRFTAGPSLLTPSEWQSLPDDPSLGAVAQLRRIHRRRKSTLNPSPDADLLVIDARPLQFSDRCGTTHHAENVFQVVQAMVRETGIPYTFLWSSRFPALDPEIRNGESCSWHPGLLSRVRAFINLAPLLDPESSADMDLLLQPHILKISVWLDAIIGLYPRTFLSSRESAWNYQLGLEKINLHQIHLCLSETSAGEGKQIFGPEIQQHITRCSNPFIPARNTAPPSVSPFKRYAMCIGNYLPHKNLSAAVAGFAGALRHGADLDGIIVNAKLSEEETAAVLDMAAGLGLAADRVAFRNSLPHHTFAELMHAAEVVILPSFHEGFSMPVIEALESDVPVLISDIPAHRELLTHEEDFFPPENPAVLTRRILSLLQHPEQSLRRQQSNLEENYRKDSFEINIRAALKPLFAEWPQTSASFPPPPPLPRKSDGPLPVSKYCELHDFSDPELMRILRSLFPHECWRLGPAYPEKFEDQLHWQAAMAGKVFQDILPQNPNPRCLSVSGPGHPILGLLSHSGAEISCLLPSPLNFQPSADAHAPTSDPPPDIRWPSFNPGATVRFLEAPLQKESPGEETLDLIFLTTEQTGNATIEQLSRMLRHCNRLLKPGGTLSICLYVLLEDAEAFIDNPFTPHGLHAVRTLVENAENWQPVSPWPTPPDQTETLLALDDTRLFFRNMEQSGSLPHYPHSLNTREYYPCVHMRNRREQLHTCLHLTLVKEDPVSREDA